MPPSKTILAAACVLLAVSAPGLRGASAGGASDGRAESVVAGLVNLPRTADGKPNMAGIWKARSGGAASDLERRRRRFGMPAGSGVVVGNRIPYQAWAATKKRDNFLNRQTGDPLAKCFMPGVPRIMYLDHPFQIFQTPQLIALTFEWSNIYRAIYTNGKPHPEGLDFWMGDSRGRWEGDTLVVNVRNHNDRTWLDGAGNFHSDAFTLVERYTLVDVDTITYEVTVEDPKVFTKPWTIRMPLERQKGVERLGDYECLPEAEEAGGLFEREPATWYPGDGRPAVPITAEQERAAAQAKAKPPAAGPKAGPIRRWPDGTPNLQGYYSASRQANFGLEPRGDGVVAARANPGFIIDPPDRKLPFQPWSRALVQTRLRPEHAYDDPAAHCFPAGAPRSTYLNEIQILQPPGYIVFLFERMGFRIIPLDGRAHLPDRVRRWQGDSVGRWDGDTLVVDATNFNGKAWLNEPYGATGGEVLTYAEHLVERFTPVDGDTMYYEGTVIDPVAYTRPWTIAFQMKQTGAELLEVACKEDDQDLPHLKAVRDAVRAGRTP